MDQVDQLILQVKGEEELKRLNAELEKERDALARLLTAQQQNAQANQQQAEKVVQLTQQVNKLRGETGAGGHGIMGASYAFQDFFSVISNTGKGGLDMMDFQRALMSVSNNVDQMARAMGASVATAAKLSLAFTGFTAALPLLTPLFQQLWDAIGGGEQGPIFALQGLDQAKQKIKELEAEYQKLHKAMTPEEEQTRRDVEALFQGREPAITGGLAQAIGASGAGAAMTPTEAASLEAEQIKKELPYTRLRPDLLAQEQVKRRRAIQDRINEENVRAAQELVAKAPREAIARRRIAAIAGQFPTVPGLAGLAADLPYAEPEARAAIEAEQAAADEVSERAKAGGEGRKAGQRRAILARRARSRAAAQLKVDEARANRDAKDEADYAWEAIEAEIVAATDWDPGTVKGRAGISRERQEAEANRVAAQRERYMRPLRGDVAGASMMGGFGGPDPMQAEEMASNALAMMQQGAGRQEAVWMAVMQKVQAIYAQMQQQQAMNSRMQMGTDQSAVYSYLTPMAP